MSEPTTLTDRLVVALNPSPEVRAIAARRAVEFAAELGDVNLLERVVLAVESPGAIGTAELAERAGASLRQIRWWTEAGYLPAMPREHTGHGHPITYPASTIVKARLMATLVRLFGMALPAANIVANELITTGRAQAGTFTLTRDSEQ
jgi:hypothetical protein